jgi:selenocysteine lyase/cysteine desulfurase
VKIDDVRWHFPISKERHFLFSGGLTPASYETIAAIERFKNEWSYDPAGIFKKRLSEDLIAVRRSFAQIIGADEDEVVITDCTGTGSNIAVGMIEPLPGSNVVLDEMAYPSSVYPWLLPHRSHVELRFIKRRDGALVRLEDFAQAIDDRTIAVNVSHVSELTGFRHNIKALAQLAHKHGALFYVDGMQAAGAVQVNVHDSDVDFYTCGAYKWLLGSAGIGFLYIARRHLNQMPPIVGYMGVTNFDRPFSQPVAYQPKPGAERFQVGIPNLIGLAATRPGLEMLLEVGMDQVEAHILDLSGYTIEGLSRRGLKVITPVQPEHRAGVVTTEIEDAAKVDEFLCNQNIDTFPFGKLLRIDPNIFNNRKDIDQLMFGLDTYLAQR